MQLRNIQIGNEQLSAPAGRVALVSVGSRSTGGLVGTGIGGGSDDGSGGGVDISLSGKRT